MVLIKKIISILMLSSIRGYQYTLSPLLGPCCRFYPSCSNYALQAIQQHGPFKGLFLASKRVLRCHPFHPGGVDPVPQSAHNKSMRTPLAGYKMKG
ncbi:MAG: membrane protein insertion efficiency factor YidD [Desulfobacterales bacterium]|nr:membrane protein insertion efficiency factor YidD [Desulfobacterales bacterium]